MAGELWNWFADLSPVVQALLAGIGTWLVTAIGAAVVVVSGRFDRRVLDAMLGFAAGVMMAASYWSLLQPSIEIARQTGIWAWWPATCGLLLGVAVLATLDKLLPHLHPGLPREKAEGPSTQWKSAVLLALAITIHNIPEGLAVGVAYGGVISGLPATNLASAVALSVGIAIQNFPEGVAVAMPLRREGLSRLKAFWYGQLSAAVEPAAAVLGAVAVTYAAPILPYALSFAAGAMIYVVVEELIPESHQAGNVDLATVSFVVGFTLMMVLDVALG